jgi:hypothetical protein
VVVKVVAEVAMEQGRCTEERKEVERRKEEGGGEKREGEATLSISPV